MNDHLKISKKKLLILLVSFFVLLIIIFTIMIHFFKISGDVIPIVQSQLSFSGQFLKDQYSIIINSDGLSYYRTAQILDYGFMISYGGIFFCLVCLVGINADPDSFWNKTTKIFAPIAIGTTIFDALENLFILITLTDPTNFPNVLAIIHSIFALIKYILIYIVVAWVFLGIISNMINKIKKKKKIPN